MAVRIKENGSARLIRKMGQLLKEKDRLTVTGKKWVSCEKKGKWVSCYNKRKWVSC